MAYQKLDIILSSPLTFKVKLELTSGGTEQVHIGSHMMLLVLIKQIYIIAVGRKTRSRPIFKINTVVKS